MTKIVKVESCGDCPYLDYPDIPPETIDEFVCKKDKNNNKMTLRNIIDLANKETTPDWCPLEDLK